MAVNAVSLAYKVSLCLQGQPSQKRSAPLEMSIRGRGNRASIGHHLIEPVNIVDMNHEGRCTGGNDGHHCVLEADFDGSEGEVSQPDLEVLGEELAFFGEEGYQRRLEVALPRLRASEVDNHQDQPERRED